MTYATSRNTITLYTVAQRERDSRSYTTVCNLVDDRQAEQRLTHYGVDARVARELVEQAHDVAHVALRRQRESAHSSSAELALPAIVHGDMIDGSEITHDGMSFRLIASVVSAPSVPVS